MDPPRDGPAGRAVIVGSGLIGRSWAMVFASGGFKVILYDIVQQQITSALENISKQMRELEKSGMLKGTLSAEKQFSLIHGCSDLKEALEGATFIQVNPPYFVPLVELVPHPETDPSTVEKTYALMKKIGQSPVKLTRETDGFVLNRLQYAVISEAWRLVGEGIVSPTDLDLVMSDGLGMRYAFIGPLETMHLNAEGITNYCERYREGMIRVLKTFGPIPEFSGEIEQKISQAMCENTPKSINLRREWRDECLARLAKLKTEMKSS
uniref:L-gulonate 3-dehydrogenase n=1 Tax=Crocodylus porosus TaxID=8502 RepID=A0A7M4F3F2_CROPO